MSFSTQRLNWHVAETAARCGGLLLVDATRSATKRFPDSLSKTVPIWAAVLNRAVAQHRGESGCEHGCSLPPWIAPSEAAAIGERLDGWAAALLAVGADVAGLSARLARPLRCLWLSQDSPLWALPDLAELPFTPLLCLSASQPLLGTGERRGGEQQGAAQGFSYVPGAGDDEESWARGLTAQLFWRHRQALLAATADGTLEAAAAALCPLRNAPCSAADGAPSATQLLRPSAPALSSAASGRHDLPPQGIAPRAACATVLLEQGDVCWLGSTGLGLANFALLQRGAQLWQTVDAVLLLCECDAASALREATAALTPPDVGRLRCVKLLRAHGPAALADCTSLLSVLPECAAFAAAHLRAGRRTVLACPDGCERASAVAVGVLAALYRESACAAAAELALPQLLAPGEPQAAASKLALRRWLAFVSAHHPQARPTRGLLKQCFQFARGQSESDG